MQTYTCHVVRVMQFSIDNMPILIEIDDAWVDGDVVQLVEQIVVRWRRPPTSAGIINSRPIVDQLCYVVNYTALEPKQEMDFWS